MGPPPPQLKIPQFGSQGPRDPQNRIPRVRFMNIRPGGGVGTPAGPHAPGPDLGELEHTWAKPRYGRKSVRFRSPDLPPGRFFHETDTRNPILGVPGPCGTKFRDVGVGGWGPMYAMVYPVGGFLEVFQVFLVSQAEADRGILT